MVDNNEAGSIEFKLSPAKADVVLRQIVLNGEIRFTDHFGSRGEVRKFTSTDAINVLTRGEIKKEPKLESGSWTYRVETARMVVIIAFRDPNSVRCITGWRKDSKHEMS